MLITLTIMILATGDKMNLMVSRDQKIADTLQVLYEKGILSIYNREEMQRVQSMRTGSWISTRLTYEEGNIYTGDILRLP